MEQKIISFAFDFATALLVLVAGLVIIKYVSKWVKKLILNSRMDNTLKPFINSVISVSLKVILGVTVVSILGIDTSSFIALLASFGFAIGLAFQGSLSNFAGGILLLTVKPFKIGDYVEVNGLGGTVDSIRILYTSLVTIDNKMVFIPNGELANSNMINYTAKQTRRVDLKFTVDYKTDHETVMEILSKIANKHSLVKQDPEPFIRMFEHSESSIVYVFRVWVDLENYWPVYYDMIEMVKQEFDKKQISIPYPQMDVHIKNDN